VNFIQNDANIVNSFSRFLIGYLKKSTKSHWFKSGQFENLHKLENVHKLKFYPSVLLLMIKMSQSARKKLDSYCKTSASKLKAIRYKTKMGI